MSSVEDWPLAPGQGYGVLICAPSGNHLMEGLAEALGDLGWGTLVAEGLPALDHPEAGRQIEQGLGRLVDTGIAPDQLVLVGLGDPGTAAFLQACKSRRVSALMVIDTPLVLKNLDVQRPIEPLEMLLNLSAPLLRFESIDPPALDPDESLLVSSHLDAAARTHESHAISRDALGVPLLFSTLQEFLHLHLEDD